MQDLIIPTGRIYRFDLLKRGWTHAMIDSLTDTAQSPLPDGLGGGDKTLFITHYSQTEVDHRETHDQEIRTAVDAARQMIPRLDHVVTRDQTATRNMLQNRGWTDSHITRLLGAPEITEPGMYGTRVRRWALERVEQAEASDEKLIASIARHRRKQAQQRQERIDEAMAAGQAVWHRTESEWLAQGRNLQVGQIVIIARRDGRADEHQVTEIVTTDVDLVTARVRRPSHAL